MIINAEYIRQFRPIAQNIDNNRIEVYIKESERIDILPAIGAKEYQRLSNIGIIETSEGDNIQDESENNIFAGTEEDLPINEWKLLNGGYYTDQNGEEQHIEGLKTSLAYLAYSRFIRNHSTCITPFGVVSKSGDDSQPTEQRTIAAISQDAQRVGQDYLAATIRFWRDVNRSSDIDIQQPARPRRRFIRIGN